MDQLSLNSIGGETLTLGIQFLYAQAGEILKRWRERRDDGRTGSDIPTAAGAGDALAVEPKPLQVDFIALDRLGPDIRRLRSALAEYAERIEAVDPGNEDILQVTDGLRCALERVVGQNLTLRGETRPDGPDIEARVDLEDIAGYVAGVLSSSMTGGRIRASVKARHVLRGGRVVGVDLTDGDDARD